MVLVRVGSDYRALAFVLQLLAQVVQGRFRLDLSRPRPKNKFHEVVVELASMLFGGHDALLLLNKIPSSPALAAERFASFRSVVLEICGPLFLRLEMYYEHFPFKLLALVCLDFDDDQREAIVREFFAAPPCELDPFFSARLRAWVRAPERMSESPVIDICRAWADKATVSIAHVERQHAVNKRVLERERGRPTVEIGVYKTLLRNVMKSHAERGRADFSHQKNSADYARRVGLETKRDRGALRGRRRRPCAKSRSSAGSRRMGNPIFHYIAVKASIAKRVRAGVRRTAEEERKQRR